MMMPDYQDNNKKQPVVIGKKTENGIVIYNF